MGRSAGGTSHPEGRGTTGEMTGLTRLRSPRTWSLRTRLLVSQVILLALVCAGVGFGTIIALQHFLTDQLDERLAETGRRIVGFQEMHFAGRRLLVIRRQSTEGSLIIAHSTIVNFRRRM